VTRIVTEHCAHGDYKPLICMLFALGMLFAGSSPVVARGGETDLQSEVIALLFPEQSPTTGGGAAFVTALLRDAEGLIELRSLAPDASLLRRALVAGRMNRGKPIVDPVTREVIGCEIEPLPDPAR
jgi:hypothetical protein